MQLLRTKISIFFVLLVFFPQFSWFSYQFFCVTLVIMVCMFWGFCDEFLWQFLWRIFVMNFCDEFLWWIIFVTYNLLTIASFRVGVPAILLANECEISKSVVFSFWFPPENIFSIFYKAQQLQDNLLCVNLWGTQWTMVSNLKN